VPLLERGSYMLETVWTFICYILGIFMAVGLIGAIVTGFEDAFHKHGTLNVLVFFAILILIIVGGLLGGHGSHGMLD